MNIINKLFTKNIINPIDNIHLNNLIDLTSKFESSDFDKSKYNIFYRKYLNSDNFIYNLNDKYKLSLEDFKIKYNKNPSSFYNYIIKNINNKETEFNELYSLLKISFISYDISNYLLNKINCKYVFDSDDLNIKIFSCNKIKYKLVYEIHNCIIFFNYLFNCKKKVNLEIYFTPFKKLFNKEFTSNEVNTGATDGTTIYLYREEEIIKVIIHELIHYHNLDVLQLNYDTAIKLKKKINIDANSVLNPNEAFTETAAIIIFTLFNSKNTFNNQFNKTIFFERLDNELKWSIYQSCKIINSFNCFKKLNDIFNKNLNCKIIQYTSVLSYYIIKSSFLLNLDLFMNEFSVKSSFKFENSYDNFYNFIIMCFNNKEFINLIDKNLEKSKKYFDSSMRMSLYG